MESLLYQNKYRIKSSRREGYDYSQAGWYYVTICTKNKQKFFGNIVGEGMVLNEIGEIVADEWQKTEIIRENVFLDKWIIMPNHIHGILVIKNPDVETPRRGVSTLRNKHHKPEWKPGTLGVIINQFKRKCTIEIRKINPNFKWQPRFYDHIIRNDKSLNKIRKYITENPLKWKLDKNYKP